VFQVLNQAEIFNEYFIILNPRSNYPSGSYPDYWDYESIPRLGIEEGEEQELKNHIPKSLARGCPPGSLFCFEEQA